MENHFWKLNFGFLVYMLLFVCGVVGVIGVNTPQHERIVYSRDSLLQLRRSDSLPDGLRSHISRVLGLCESDTRGKQDKEKGKKKKRGRKGGARQRDIGIG